MIRLCVPQIDEHAIEEVVAILRSGMLIQGRNIAALEKALKACTGAAYVSAVSSGTAALHLALAALEIGPGDAVFVPAFTFPATANVVELQRARPVFVDVVPGTYCMTADGLRKALASWSGPEIPRAVMPVHEFGAPCSMDEIMVVAREHGLFVVEDAACALGTRCGKNHAGTIGDIGCFSFHPRKGITTGEGGAVVTNDPALGRRLSCLRNHGIERLDDGSFDFVYAGFNYRLTDFQGALGCRQLAHLEKFLRQRYHLAKAYQESLSMIPALLLPDYIDGHSWQTYMVVLPGEVSRSKVIEKLFERDIETNLGAQALHMLAYYKKRCSYEPGDFPVATRLYQQGLALPLHAGLRIDQVKIVAEGLASAMTESS